MNKNKQNHQEQTEAAQNKPKTLEEIQKLHNLLGRTLENKHLDWEPEDRNDLEMVQAGLCWVLGHQNGSHFIEKAAEQCQQWLESAAEIDATEAIEAAKNFNPGDVQ